MRKESSLYSVESTFKGYVSCGSLVQCVFLKLALCEFLIKQLLRESVWCEAVKKCVFLSLHGHTPKQSTFLIARTVRRCKKVRFLKGLHGHTPKQSAFLMGPHSAEE